MENATRFPHVLEAELLDGLPQDERIDFVNRCVARSVTDRTEILTQGAAPEGAFIVVAGVVEIRYACDAGNIAIIGHAKPKNIIGIFETIAQRPCAASCTAMPMSELLYCPTSLLKDYLQRAIVLRNYARIAYDIMKHDNVSKAIDQFYTAEQKICYYLDKFAGDTGVFIQNQSYLANAAGCTRQTVNKELSHLREHEIIQSERGHITILDTARLAQRIKDLENRKSKKASRSDT